MQSSKNTQVMSLESCNSYIRTNHSQNINLSGGVINCVETMQCMRELIQKKTESMDFV